MTNRTLLLSAGILLLALMTLLCVQRLPTSIESDIALRLNTLLEHQGIDWAQVSVDGRDVFIEGEAPSNDDMLHAIELAETLDYPRPSSSTAAVQRSAKWRIIWRRHSLW